MKKPLFKLEFKEIDWIIPAKFHEIYSDKIELTLLNKNNLKKINNSKINLINNFFDLRKFYKKEYKEHYQNWINKKAVESPVILFENKTYNIIYGDSQLCFFNLLNIPIKALIVEIIEF
jgi:hypothetical protein